MEKQFFPKGKTSGKKKWFYGVVLRRNGKYYKIRYDDKDGEDVDAKELFTILSDTKNAAKIDELFL